MKRLKVAVTTKSEPGVLVRDETKVIDSCKAAIRRTLNLKSPALESMGSKNKTKFTFRLSDPNAYDIKVRDRTYKVIDVLAFPSSLIIYSLGVYIEFIRDDKNIYIEHISLTIIESLGGREARPVLRAEWDCRPEKIVTGENADKDPHEHAQPHWHVYPSEISREKESLTPVFAEEAVLDFHAPDDSTIQEFPPIVADARQEQDTDSESDWESNWPGGEKFHFAMGAQWQEGPLKPLNDVLDPLNLGNWIEGCLSYLLDQLRYLNGKLPKGIQ